MTYDVAIVGGALVGATLACVLAEQGLSVAVIEARESMPEPDDTITPRVSAITRASERIFRNLGVWSLLPERHLGIFREMTVWDLPAHGEIHFDSADIAEPSLGYIVENDRLLYALTQRLALTESVTMYQPAVLKELWINRSSTILNLQGASVEARLVVGADGGSSRVRELAGIEVRQGDYAQRAVVSIVHCQQGHQHTAWQRFLASGPLAVLPLSADNACIVWSTTPEQAHAFTAMTSDSFDEALNVALDGKLGRVSSVGPRQSFALRWLQANAYVSDRLALIGDAAHIIHPLAGQGVNLGLYDAAVLGEVIAAAAKRGRNFFERPVLRRYERWRRGHNTMVHSAMNGFFWLFGSDVPGVRSLRNVGLAATNKIDPLKRLIMRHACGLTGDLPQLARALRKAY